MANDDQQAKASLIELPANDVLSNDQKERLDETLIKLKISDEQYFRDHPELKSLMQVFFGQVLEYKPDNVLAFCGDFFTRKDLYAFVKKASEAAENAEEKE